MENTNYQHIYLRTVIFWGAAQFFKDKVWMIRTDEIILAGGISEDNQNADHFGGNELCKKQKRARVYSVYKVYSTIGLSGIDFTNPYIQDNHAKTPLKQKRFTLTFPTN